MQGAAAAEHFGSWQVLQGKVLCRGGVEAPQMDDAADRPPVGPQALQDALQVLRAFG